MAQGGWSNGERTPVVSYQYHPEPRKTPNEAEIVALPQSIGLEWHNILKPIDSERCGVCGELKASLVTFGKPEGKPNGKILFVCSSQCLYYSWSNLVQYVMKEKGIKICRFPGCTVECPRRDNGGRFDYCKWTHKDDHYSFCKALFQCEELVLCNLPGCNRLCPKYGILKRYCCKNHMQTTLACNLCMKGQEPVMFYDHDEPFYEFSNFYQFAPFELEGKTWKSSEHYFQAKKFVGTPYGDCIRNCDSPRKALELARKYSDWIRGDWDEMRLKVMYLALLAKFSSHGRLGNLLCSTGNREIKEHTYRDKFWGDGYGSGNNHLGKLLMKVRSILRGDKATK